MAIKSMAERFLEGNIVWAIQGRVKSRLL